MPQIRPIQKGILIKKAGRYTRAGRSAYNYDIRTLKSLCCIIHLFPFRFIEEIIGKMLFLILYLAEKLLINSAPAIKEKSFSKAPITF